MTSSDQIAAGPGVTAAAAFASESDSDQTQGYRAGAYRLLAALLRSVPDQAVLDHVAGLAEVDSATGELATALSALGQAASVGNVDAISDEFHALFIGLGRGELVPFGSWYLTGFLMEKPLGVLRDDLALLGYQRSSDTSEPEDHIAALCEVMSLMISDASEQAADEDSEMNQRRFFEAHIKPWAEKFFRDLSESRRAEFYGAVARLGLEFLAFETRYLSMDV